MEEYHFFVKRCNPKFSFIVLSILIIPKGDMQRSSSRRMLYSILVPQRYRPCRNPKRQNLRRISTEFHPFQNAMSNSPISVKPHQDDIAAEADLQSSRRHLPSILMLRLPMEPNPISCRNCFTRRTTRYGCQPLICQTGSRRRRIGIVIHQDFHEFAFFQLAIRSGRRSRCRYCDSCGYGGLGCCVG